MKLITIFTAFLISNGVLIALLMNMSPARKLLLCPRRKADFKHRHFEYWFDEMIGYSDLTHIRFKFEVDKQNRYGKDLLRAVAGSRYYASGVLDHEVQLAYRQHIHNKFEEIFLKANI